MATVLVTGGAGYIGSQIVRQLIEAGHRAVVLDDLSASLRPSRSASTELIVGDVADRSMLDMVFERLSPSVVMHLAATTSAPESVLTPLRFYRENTEKSRVLIEAVVAAPSQPSFIFSSSAAVYGEVASDPVTETHPASPLSPYGASKLMTERMLADTAHAHGLNYAVLRYFNVVGLDSPDSEASRAAAPGSLLDVVMDAARGRREAVPLYGVNHPTRDGTPVRDFIHVTDVAAAHLALLPLLGRSGAPRIFNCGNGHGYSVIEIIEAVEVSLGRPIYRTLSAKRDGDASQVIADATRLRQWTNWRPARLTLPELLQGIV